MPVKRRVAALVSIVVLSLVACGCGGGGATGDGTADSLQVDTTLCIALVPTVEALPLYAAQAEGLFDSLGLSVRLLTYQAAMDADTAFWRGEANMLLTDLVKTVLWQETDSTLSIVLQADLGLSLVVTPECDVRRAEDLNEKIIALTRHSALDFAADQILANVGLDEKAMNRPQINNIDLRRSMTDQRQYDGAFLPQPYAAIALEHGARLIATDGADANPMVALIARGDTVGRHFGALIQAYDLACERINNRGSGALRDLPLDVLPTDSLFAMPTMRRSTVPDDSLRRRIRSWLIHRDL